MASRYARCALCEWELRYATDGEAARWTGGPIPDGEAITICPHCDQLYSGNVALFERAKRAPASSLTPALP